MKSVAVLGFSNTGKTTFIESLIAGATDAGISTGVLKYSRHRGDFDRPDSDTGRLGKTVARFVGYRGLDRWHISVPGETDTTGSAEIPEWLIPLAESVDLLVLEGRSLPDSLVCLTAGNATTVEELKFPPESAHVVITASEELAESIQEMPLFVTADNAHGATEMLRLLQEKE